MKRIVFIFLGLVLINSCRKPNPNVNVLLESKTYIHLSHTRTSENPMLDNLIENMNFSSYDMIWLGGDLAYHTSADIETMNHIDSIFHVGQETTLWSIGNHDYTSLPLIQEYTNRPAYYAYNQNELTFVVLDTQDDLSSISGEQKDFFLSVADTIENSTHLIILHHKLIWMFGDEFLEPMIPDVANGGLGDCFYCINPNNFYTEIYPTLVDIQNQGIEVICIGGDVGFNTKEFQYTTPEDIQFLASGISWGDNQNNKALIFHHNLVDKTLDWEFKRLLDL